MKLKLAVLLNAVALQAAPICLAQVAPATALIRDVAAGSFALVVKADGSVVGLGAQRRRAGGQAQFASTHHPEADGDRPARQGLAGGRR